MVKITNKKETDIFQKPPVVVVLGHVDHGKSSLLEAIKDFKITSKESGGITQHIGAYQVEEKGRKITFIDTPGHEAFSAMRARGAQVADIALLVIDAAQSVQPQTKEAIALIKRVGLPMIVVLNKIDLPTADPEKIKRDLLNYDVAVESYGGKVPCVEVSAKEKRGITELLDMILLLADLHELKTPLSVPPEGVIIESYLDKKQGPLATAIVQKGILNKKVIIATDSAIARIRTLRDFQNKEISEAYPAQPVIILGFDKVPMVGEKFKTYSTLEEAMAKIKQEEAKRTEGPMIIAPPPDGKILNIILKTDVFGSMEAIQNILKNLPQEKVILRILKSEVGDINENDIKLAQMAKAEIIGFRVKIDSAVIQLMKSDANKNIRIRIFEVIYDLIQEIRSRIDKLTQPEKIREEIGKLKVLKIFLTEKNRQIIGGKIIEGELRKGLRVQVYRIDPSLDQFKKIGEGKIINLQRNKKDVERLSKGEEAGILFEGNAKAEEGDIICGFVEERKKYSSNTPES